MFFDSLKKLIKQFIEFVIIILDCFTLLAPASEKSFYDVCVVKVDALGDFFVALDFLYNISLKNKDKRKILICNKLVYDLALDIGHFDEVHPIELKKFRTNYIYRFNQLRKLKSINVKISIQNNYSRNTSLGDSIIRAIDSPIKKGHYGDYINQNYLLKIIGNLWYSDLCQFNHESIHETEANIKFLNYLGITKIEKYEIKKLSHLSNFNFYLKNRYIVISPGASDHSRVWPIKKFICLIEYISSKFDYDIILCGSKFDKKITNIIMKNLKNNNKLLDLTGKLNIQEFVEFIRNSNFVLSNDSASVHIAYAVGVKSFCFSGGWNFGRFVPYPISIKNQFRPTTFFNKDCSGINLNRSRTNRSLNKKNLNYINTNQVFDVINKYLGN